MSDIYPHKSGALPRAGLDTQTAQKVAEILYKISDVSAVTITDPEKARELLMNFSAFFRYSLKSTGHFITLEKELENVKNYLVLEKARFGDRLNTDISVEPELMQTFIPRLCIQPLVENAIIHGISPLEKMGTVSIDVRSGGAETTLISVSDDGVGIPPENLPLVKNQNFSSGRGHGVGLYNVSQRLRMLCGEESDLMIKSQMNSGTTVSFKIKKFFTKNEEVPV